MSWFVGLAYDKKMWGVAGLSANPKSDNEEEEQDAATLLHSLWEEESTKRCGEEDRLISSTVWAARFVAMVVSNEICSKLLSVFSRILETQRRLITTTSSRGSYAEGVFRTILLLGLGFRLMLQSR